MNITDEKLLQIISMLVVSGGTAEAHGESVYASDAKAMAGVLLHDMITEGATVYESDIDVRVQYYMNTARPPTSTAVN